MSTKIMISLPDQLALRMRASIPDRERSSVIAKLIEKEIQAREEELYQAAIRANLDEALAAEEKILERNFGNDGLEDV